MTDLSTVSGLKDSLACLSDDEKAMAQKLVEMNQAHLFEGWAASPQDDAEKHAFFDSIAVLERGYPGGVAQYCENARQLLADSMAGANPFDGYKPNVPMGTTMEVADSTFVEAEEAGAALMKDSVFVLVAGGLGERLGYSGIKVELPVELTTQRCYLEVYIQHLLAFERRAGPGTKIPLVIMTSGDTHKKTLALLKSGAYFGMEEGQVTVVKQEKVAALADNEARIARDGTYGVETKPHGHGDVHLLMHQSGLAQQWVEAGKQWICFFQDTNAMAFRSLPVAVGVSSRSDFHMNSMAIPRKAKDAVGAIVQLASEEKGSMTCNVEYNQLDPLLRASGFPEGDVAGEDGLSPYPGNTNQLVMHLPRYAATLARTGGLMPEFVNPKYADAAKTTFKKPTRLECMMQDYARAVADDPVGFTTLPDWISYSPVKNNLVDAAAKVAAGNMAASASAGEMEYYEANAQILRLKGVDVAPAKDVEFAGVPLKHPPHVVLFPEAGVTYTEITSAFPSPQDVHVREGATLVVRSAGVVFRKADINGALDIECAPGATAVVDGLTVDNEGDVLVPLGEAAMAGSAPETLRIRGFCVQRRAYLRLRISEPGEHVINDETVAKYTITDSASSGGHHHHL